MFKENTRSSLIKLKELVKNRDITYEYPECIAALEDAIEETKNKEIINSSNRLINSDKTLGLRVKSCHYINTYKEVYFSAICDLNEKLVRIIDSLEDSECTDNICRKYIRDALSIISTRIRLTVIDRDLYYQKIDNEYFTWDALYDYHDRLTKCCSRIVCEYEPEDIDSLILEIQTALLYLHSALS